jgi:hypothetical protein
LSQDSYNPGYFLVAQLRKEINAERTSEGVEKIRGRSTAARRPQCRFVSRAATAAAGRRGLQWHKRDGNATLPKIVDWQPHPSRTDVQITKADSDRTLQVVTPGPGSRTAGSRGYRDSNPTPQAKMAVLKPRKSGPSSSDEYNPRSRISPDPF